MFNNEIKNRMPSWGPYSKKYMGISKIIENSKMKGGRFDLVIHPTYANSSVPVPNVTFPSSYHPWEASADGRFFSYRYELEWKDQLYADVAFFKLDEESYGVRVEYVNETDLPQNCLLNYFAALEYPEKVKSSIMIPEKHDSWSAVDYKDFAFAKKRPWDRLNPDGMRRGEIHNSHFVDGNGIGEIMYYFMFPHLELKPFGGEAGDRVSYSKGIKDYEDAVITIRYRTVNNTDSVKFNSNFGVIEFEVRKELGVTTLEVGRIDGKNSFYLELCALGSETNGIEIDYIIITEKEEADKITFDKVRVNSVPNVEINNGQIALKYTDVEDELFLTILNRRVRHRKLHSGSLEDAVVTRLSNSDHTYDDLTRSFSGSFLNKNSDEGFYHNSIVEAIYVNPHQRHIEFAVISSSKEKSYTKGELEKHYDREYAAVEGMNYNQVGEQYELSCKILRNTLLTNVVYPIYRHGTYIIHHTPGKRWDSLYTWDSGFIGLGLLESDEALAEYILDIYLSEEDNEDFAFLAHGSLVPTQFYLYFEMLQTSKNKEKLYKYYHRLRRYYEFMVGKSEGSTIARYKSGILTTYDYFYNCSGMDDYPPQVEMHKKGLEKYISPVVPSAHVIRIGKIMCNVAKHLGYENHVSEYEQDIKRISKGLQQYSWDEESEYFSYVLHDKEGNPKKIFCTEQGENYNKGMEGISPLFAGICTEQQKVALLSHLTSKEEMFSEVGISTVDMSSSYFIDNGYWNGNVWFPYQWLIWKAMLDIGKSDIAYNIAITALDAWKTEVDHSYNTFEQLNIETGRGGWFHQFGGLSAPICVWGNAYFKQGKISSGFDLWIESYTFNESYTEGEINFSYTGDSNTCIIVVMNAVESYEVRCNDKVIDFNEKIKGTLEIVISKEIKAGNLKVSRKA